MGNGGLVGCGRRAGRNEPGGGSPEDADVGMRESCCGDWVGGRQPPKTGAGIGAGYVPGLIVPSLGTGAGI